MIKVKNDLTGRQFGRLKVLYQFEDYISPQGRHKPQWMCECSCDGKNIIVSSDSLRGGQQSCGCLAKENTIYRNKNLLKKYNTYDLSDEYGIGYTSTTNKPFYFDLDDYDLIKDYCWRENEKGYINTTFNHKTIFMHRLVTKCPKYLEVDHKNHNVSDNRKNNLSIVTHFNNMQNYHNNNTSNVVGVCWHNHAKKWMSYIKVNNKQIYLGLFDDFNEAVKVRKEAEMKYFN